MAKFSNRHKRGLLLVFGFALMVSAVFIFIKIFNDNIVFFVKPSELLEKQNLTNNKEFRLGGFVALKSIKSLDDAGLIEFIITDFKNSIIVRYRGVRPSLFKEGQGVVAYGKIISNIFYATELLAKHDENYKPYPINGAEP